MSGWAISSPMNWRLQSIGPQHFATALAIAVGVPVGLYAGWRGLALAQMIRRLRLRRISPPDARTQTEIQEQSRGARPVELRRRNRHAKRRGYSGRFQRRSLAVAEVSTDHCSRMMSRSFSTVPRGATWSAHESAVALKRIGIDKVWVLEGGLKAWREQGFPVSHMLEPPEIVAERHGVKLPRAIITTSWIHTRNLT